MSSAAVYDRSGVRDEDELSRRVFLTLITLVLMILVLRAFISLPSWSIGLLMSLGVVPVHHWLGTSAKAGALVVIYTILSLLVLGGVISVWVVFGLALMLAVVWWWADQM